MTDIVKRLRGNAPPVRRMPPALWDKELWATVDWLTRRVDVLERYLIALVCIVTVLAVVVAGLGLR